MRQCVICGKTPVVGHTITHRGMLKKQGGVGRRTVRVNLRRFMPNLQPTRLSIDGTVRRQWVCAACIRSERVVKGPLKPSHRSPSDTALRSPQPA